MKTDNYAVLKISFAISFFIIAVGMIMKITGYPHSRPFLVIGFFSSLVYIVMALYEIMNSRKIDNPEKIMWIVGFLFFNFVAGILYLFSARKRIVSNY